MRKTVLSTQKHTFAEMNKVEQLAFTDPVYIKKDRLSGLDRIILKFIKDERDIVFVHTILKMLLIIVPVAIYLFIPGQFSWWVAVVYLSVNWLFFTPPYILMLHCTSHRPLFKREYAWMNRIIPWFLGPFFGETPETYWGHHMGMHHPENNLKDDLSTTMPYQRDSFIDFMKYFLRFFTVGMVELTNYFTRKKRYKLRMNTILGELSWYAVVIALSFFNWPATLVVFIIPFVFTRFMMMAGNWGQHAFVDADAPANCYRNSISCINVAYNKKCFNDGYHIVHHFQPAMHYTDMAREFHDNKEAYAKEKAIVFEGLDFFMVWFLLMIGSYKTLAKKFVHLDDRFKSDEEVIAFLKTRTAKISGEKLI